MKLELNRFIKDLANGNPEEYDYRNDNLMINFAKFLGIHTKYPRSSHRPDNDPKWLPFEWSASNGTKVNDVRMMTFNHLTAKCIIELSKERDLKFPNGWSLHETLETLIQMRREYKRGIILSINGLNLYDGEDYEKWSMISKFLINSLYSVVARFGGYFGLAIHEVNAVSRLKVIDAVKKINETGIVLYVNSDFIAYRGNQVEIPDVHHEHFDSIILLNRGIVYGTRMQSYLISNMKLDFDTEYTSNNYTAIEKARDMYDRRITRLKESLMTAINRTKEDVDRELDLDSDCSFL